MKKFFNRHPRVYMFAPVVLIILFTLPAIFSLFHHGFFRSDDGEWMVIRFSAFYSAFREGQFPVRLLGRLNHEYGYPVTNFLYPGFLYVALLFKVIGLGYINSIKAILLFSTCLSGIFSYFWLKKHVSSLSAFIGALTYVYFPYHLFDIYSRGSVGEIMGLCVLPLVLYFIDRKRMILAGFSYSLLILSHNTLAFLFTPFLIIYTLLLYKDKRISYLFLGLLFSSFFWIPAIFDTQYTVFSRVQVANWSNYFVTNETVGLIGVSGVLILIMAVALSLKRRSRVLVFFTLSYVFSLLLALPVSSFLWQLGLFPKIVQFPWRFLLISIWSGSFLTSLWTEVLPSLWKKVFICFWVSILLFSAFPYFSPSAYLDKDDNYYLTNEDTTTVSNEYMPIWVKQPALVRPDMPSQIIKGKGTVTVKKHTSIYEQIQFQGKTPSVLQINTLYFPGWNIYINGKNTPFLYNNPRGILEIALPAGNILVEAKFQETPLRLFADSISLISFAGVVLYGLRFYLKRKNKSK